MLRTCDAVKSQCLGVQEEFCRTSRAFLPHRRYAETRGHDWFGKLLLIVTASRVWCIIFALVDYSILDIHWNNPGTSEHCWNA